MISEWRVNKALRLRVVPRAVEVTDVAIADRCLSGVIGGPGHEAVVAVMARAEGTTARTRVVHSSERTEFSLGLPAVPQPPAGRPVKWKVEAVTDDEEVLGLAYTDRRPAIVTTKTATCVVQPNRNGNLFLTEWALGAIAETLAVSTDGVVSVTGSVLGPGAQTVGLVARSKRSTAIGSAVPVVAGRFSAELTLTHEVYRFGVLPLPTGGHDFGLRIGTDDGDSVEVPLRMSSMLNEVLPVRIDSTHHEGRVVRGPGECLTRSLVRPIGDARSRYHQQPAAESRHTEPGDDTWSAHPAPTSASRPLRQRSLDPERAPAGAGRTCRSTGQSRTTRCRRQTGGRPSRRQHPGVVRPARLGDLLHRQHVPTRIPLQA